MYTWICKKPYKHHARFRVWYADLEGERRYLTLDTESEASKWIETALPRLVRDGRPIGEVTDAYLASLTDHKPQTVVTQRYRIQSVTKGRQGIAVEAFPWLVAWDQHAKPQARASQIGILTALRGLVAFAGLRGDPLKGIKVTGRVSEGKKQLGIDQGRAFVEAALTAGDPLAVAAAAMAFTGARPGEVLTLTAGDVDDQGRILHIRGTKTRAADRPVSVDPQFVPWLLAAASGKQYDELLFPWVPDRARAQQDPAKARKDALMRRVEAICETAGVPLVVPHSLRGLNTTLRKTGGASDDTITRAMGHLNISTTQRHYFAPGLVEKMDSKKAHGRLLIPAKAA